MKTLFAFVIPFTIFGVFCSSPAAAQTCAELMNPTYTSPAESKRITLIGTQLIYKRQLANLLKDYLGFAVSSSTWDFKNLYGSSPMGSPLNLSLEISDNNYLRGEFGEMTVASNVVLNPASNDNYFLKNARIAFRIQGVDYAHSAIMGNSVKDYATAYIRLDDTTQITQLKNKDDVLEVVFKNYYQNELATTTHLKIRKVYGVLEVSISTRESGIHGLWSKSKTFLARNNTWQNEPFKRSQSYSWFERTFLGYENEDFDVEKSD